jgi:hypothetical protein
MRQFGNWNTYSNSANIKGTAGVLTIAVLAGRLKASFRAWHIPWSFRVYSNPRL